MNAALLLMASTWSAGAEPVPAAQPTIIQAQCCGAPAPVAASHCDSCGKPNLLSKLKARFAKPPAPCCAAYTPPCDACSKHHAAHAPRPNLLDTLRDRCGKHKGGCSTCGCSSTAVPCCAGPVYGAPIAPTTTPVVEPKKAPMEMPPKTTEPKKGGSDSKIDPKKNEAPDGFNLPSIPNIPGANAGQPAPLTPVSAPKLSGADSPY